MLCAWLQGFETLNMILVYPLISSITSSKLKDPKCHLHISHCSLGSTTKSKWKIARIQSQLYTQRRKSIYCRCKEQYNMYIEIHETLHFLQHLSESKTVAGFSEESVPVIFTTLENGMFMGYTEFLNLPLQKFGEWMNAIRIIFVSFYKWHISCSSVSSSASKGSKHCINILHNHLGTTSKPKWKVTRIWSQILTQWRTSKCCETAEYYYM